jgi:glutamyl-tRNA reductase
MQKSSDSEQALPPETAILTTCNRTEIYCAGPRHGSELTLAWLAEIGKVSPEVLRSHVYTLQDGDAAQHAFRVASGLDSMVIGEPQILGQLKHAVRAAEEAGSLGTTLNQLFQRSFSVAKEVRARTGIGAHSISLAAAAVRLAGQHFGSFAHLRVLFLGAGEMTELAAAHFASKNPAAMVIANRTIERAETLANRFGGALLPITDVAECLGDFDVVVSCTSSQVPLIGVAAVEAALEKRLRKPMLFVDLAVPPDVEPEVGGLKGVALYTIDDVAHVVESGHQHRRAAVEQAEAIIALGVKGFNRWIAERNVVPLIHRLDMQARQWQTLELQRARRRLAAGDDIEVVLQRLSRGLTQKLLHGPLAELHRADAEARERAYSAIELLFLRGGGRSPPPDSKSSRSV